jgi:hypothetical protein
MEAAPSTRLEKAPRIEESHTRIGDEESTTERTRSLCDGLKYHQYTLEVSRQGFLILYECWPDSERIIYGLDMERSGATTGTPPTVYRIGLAFFLPGLCWEWWERRGAWRRRYRFWSRRPYCKYQFIRVDIPLLLYVYVCDDASPISV